MGKFGKYREPVKCDNMHFQGEMILFFLKNEALRRESVNVSVQYSYLNKISVRFFAY